MWSQEGVVRSFGNLLIRNTTAYILRLFQKRFEGVLYRDVASSIASKKELVTGERLVVFWWFQVTAVCNINELCNLARKKTMTSIVSVKDFFNVPKPKPDSLKTLNKIGR